MYFSKGKVPLGCRLRPMSSIWHQPAVNAWPLCDGGRLISPSASNWTPILVITANSFSFSFFYFLAPLPVTVVFFYYYFFLSLSPRSPSASRGEQHLASHFMDLRSAFSRVDVGRHVQKSTGGIAKRGETQRRRSKSVISAPLCVSLPATAATAAAATVVRGAQDVLPNAGECHQKCWHYRHCHLFLNRESSRGLCHRPIKAARWSIYKEVYNLLNGTVKY